MDSLQKLISYFREFPGIGPRQAERFAFFLLVKNNGYRESLAEEIISLKKNISLCKECFRFFSGSNEACPICKDKTRDTSLLMIVAKDVDLNTIEKTKKYSGRYFVLGGHIPILDKDPEEKVRLKELIKYLERKSTIKEIIFALSVNTEGEYTRNQIENAIKPMVQKNNITVSVLGRGLSTGTEIEYSDKETIASALEHRTKENI